MEIKVSSPCGRLQTAERGRYGWLFPVIIVPTADITGRTLVDVPGTVVLVDVARRGGAVTAASDVAALGAIGRTGHDALLDGKEEGCDGRGDICLFHFYFAF